VWSLPGKTAIVTGASSGIAATTSAAAAECVVDELVPMSTDRPSGTGIHRAQG
jgi:NAD(P)-dependent dehydrogenase (short-subunit alcohol dehydrogenase family)